MALTVVVRTGDGDSPPKISFDAPRVVIGRGEGCEVRLPDPSVSHRHASIRQRGTEYIVVDEGSTNGTFVGPVLLSPQASRVLKSGDRIRVGRVWLEIVLEHVPATQQPQLATKEIALALVADALKAQGQEAELVLQVTEGPDAGLRLEIEGFGKRYVVGRGQTADLRVTDTDASRRHVELERHGDQLKVRELGSKNGSLLDGEPLTDKGTVWKPGQILRLGTNQLSYTDPLSSALAQLEAAEDERLDATEDLAAAHADAPLNDVAARAASTAAPPAPLVEQPRTLKKRGNSGIAHADLFVAALALFVLVVSALGLYWLFSGD
ncbi:MAG TPA: FHA domain-containing protein [Polyangiaceae bacterium]|nr:FHA domain-containing protein [Polyangiaceae bacterium]